MLLQGSNLALGEGIRNVVYVHSQKLSYLFCRARCNASDGASLDQNTKPVGDLSCNGALLGLGECLSHQLNAHCGRLACTYYLLRTLELLLLSSVDPRSKRELRRVFKDISKLPKKAEIPPAERFRLLSPLH